MDDVLSPTWNRTIEYVHTSVRDLDLEQVEGPETFSRPDNPIQR